MAPPSPWTPPHLSYVLQHSKDEGARREAYMKGYSSPAANLGRLHEMTQCRHELAKLTGFGSFAAYTVRTSGHTHTRTHNRTISPPAKNS